MYKIIRRIPISMNYTIGQSGGGLKQKSKWGFTKLPFYKMEVVIISSMARL